MNKFSIFKSMLQINRATALTKDQLFVKCPDCNGNGGSVVVNKDTGERTVCPNDKCHIGLVPSQEIDCLIGENNCTTCICNKSVECGFKGAKSCKDVIFNKYQEVKAEGLL